MGILYTYLYLFLFCLAISFFLHSFFLKNSRKYLLKKANPTGIRWSSQQKPISGGFTFFVIFFLTIIVYVLVFDSGVIFRNEFVGVILVAMLSFFMGLADDIMNTPPLFKFIVQVLSAVLLIHFNIYINVSTNELFNYVLTVLWVVGIMNSINMLDNMDSIVTIVAIAISAGLVFNIYFYSSPSNTFFMFVAIGMLASLISFLYFNWSPSKMYMGDNGSQLIGVYLAVMGIMFFWNTSTPSISGRLIEKQFIIVAFAFIVPLSDTITVTINRLLRGKSPFVGGKDHTTHHLSYMGLKDKGVAVVLGLTSFVCVAVAIVMNAWIVSWGFWHNIVFGLISILIFVLLFLTTKLFHQNKD